MVSSYGFINTLSRHRPSRTVRYGVTVSAIAVMTFVRFLAPAYVAPFLLYIPVLLAVSLVSVGVSAPADAAPVHSSSKDTGWDLK